ncbi:MAG: nitrous oxide reductase accessory protein NosL [bacterium]|nr:MAG: nitrous oxide reductase accessory protein NosL [bacterium]
MKARKANPRPTLVILAALVITLASVTVLPGADEGCFYCGMKRAMFGHSWMDIEREDGSTVGVCSVHCAAVDMALNIDKPARSITVGDYDSKKPIDAEQAYWVIGGEKMGVMTARAKWAFGTKESADAFMKQNGGQAATFEEVMKATFNDMYEDTLMIQKKRKMKRMNQGGMQK